jgi:DNA polymerase-3 subunit beta
VKIEINREEFLSVFQTAAAIAPSRSPKPILQNVKLVAIESGATLLATDMEIGVRLSVPGITVITPGECILPVSRFNSVLRESSDESLSIETDETGSIVKGKRSKFRLPAENPDEFPDVAEFDETSFYEFPSNLFKQLIRRTIFATDAESARFALGGILLEIEGDVAVAVGTDGRRLAKMEGPVKTVGEPKVSESKTIVPTRSMNLIDRALPDSDDPIQIVTRPNDVLIRYTNGVIYSRLVEGRFPPWKDVFPKRENAVTIDLNVGPVFSCLRQASIVTSDESRGIDLVFGDGTLVMTNTTADVGESHVEMPIPYDGEEITMTLDHRYFADFLKVLEADRIFQMEIESAESAAICSTDDGYGYVIMPLSRDRKK